MGRIDINKTERVPYEHKKELETIQRFFNTKDIKEVVKSKHPKTSEVANNSFIKVETPFNEIEQGHIFIKKKKPFDGIFNKSFNEHYYCLQRGDLFIVHDYNTKESNIYSVKDNKKELLRTILNSGRNVSLVLNRYAKELKELMQL